MPQFKPVKQSRLSEEIAGQLKESILLGQFKPGDRLPAERDLSEQFQVSRVAVREALRALENAGFIVTRQGVTGGAFVTDLTFQHLVNAFLDLFMAEKISIPELHEVRRLIEPEVARLAAGRVTPDYAQRLRDAVKGEERPSSSLSDVISKMTAVHFILAEMSGNRFYEAIVRSLLGLTKNVIEAVESDPPSLHPPGLHNDLVDAVLAGDAEKAAAAMERHTVEFGDNLINMERIYREKKSQSFL